MAFFESYKQKNGNFITVEWTFNEWIGAKIVGFLVMIYFVGIIALVIPTLWLFFYFISIEEHRNDLNITAVLAGIYLLFDYHYGLICWNLISVLFSPETFSKVVYYSTGLMFVHLILLFFGRKIYYLEKNVSDSARLLGLLCYTVVLIYFSYHAARILINLFISQQEHIVSLAQ